MRSNWLLAPKPRLRRARAKAADVMSQDELRHWISEFLYNPAFGWSRSKLAFARFLGIDLSGLRSKLRAAPTRAWIYPGEQIRFSRQIRRLLAGELIPKQMRAPSGQLRWEAVLADHPQPIRRHELARPRFDLATVRLRWEVAPSSAPPLPSLRTLFERAEPSPTADEEPLRFAQCGDGPRRLPYPVTAPRSLRRPRNWHPKPPTRGY
jgi:hypothetical protein